MALPASPNLAFQKIISGIKKMTPTEFMHLYENASATHNLEATMNLIDESAVYFFSNETSHIGKSAVQEAIKANFDAIGVEKFRIRDVNWLLETDEVAVCVYAYQWSGQINGQVVSGSGRGTSVLRHDGAS